MKCEVLVIGGGPAGTLVATNLARSGKKVIQLVSSEQSKGRPFEVLTPATRQLLRKNNLSEPEIMVSKCRGVLSVWEDSKPDFHDYEFATCVPGLSIDRNAFHHSLQNDAVATGVYLVKISRPGINKSIARLGEYNYCEIEGGPAIIGPELIIDASGRQSNFTDEHSQKKYFSNQVAFYISHQVSNWTDYLLVEAVPEGWWYIPPSIEGRTQLVFLTDMDNIPVNHIERAKWLSHCYKESIIINKFAVVQPNFENAKGTDARFFRQSVPVHHKRICVGDSALALDPLSGSGTWAALAGAEQLASLINKGGEISTSYCEWYQDFFEREHILYKETCLKALERFPNSEFWKRKLNKAV